MSVEESAVRPIEDFLNFLRDGRFMIQRSRGSGRHVFYPRVVEPTTGSADLEWVQASGRGVVYASTVQRSRQPAADTHLCLIDLAEGPRMMSRVEGIAPDAVQIGMAVEARIVEEDGSPLIVFVPATDVGAA